MALTAQQQGLLGGYGYGLGEDAPVAGYRLAAPDPLLARAGADNIARLNGIGTSNDPAGAWQAIGNNLRTQGWNEQDINRFLNMGHGGGGQQAVAALGGAPSYNYGTALGAGSIGSSGAAGAQSVWNPGGDRQNPWLGAMSGGAFTPTPTTPSAVPTPTASSSVVNAAAPTGRPLSASSLTGIHAPMQPQSRLMPQRNAIVQAADIGTPPTAPTTPAPTTTPLSSRIATPQGQRTQGMLRGVWT